MRNAITIDLEDYYHVSAFRDHVSNSHWSSQQSRVERNTEVLLDLLDEAKRKATFFTLGWVAEHHPSLIRRAADRGHEIACHSLCHQTVYEMTPEEFRNDTLQAKNLLEDCSGKSVQGYRAPSFSITQKSLWAFEILVQLGFTYDSSVFPVHHPSYGIPDGSRVPYRVSTPSGTIVEFPMPTLQLAGHRAPFAGGAYFRLLPYWYTRWGINYLNRVERRPVCVYLHPWELDPNQPRIKGNLTARMRHYIGLRNTPTKFARLVREFDFCPLCVLAAEL